MLGMLDTLSLKNTRLGLETLDLMGYEHERIVLVLNRADSRVGISDEDVERIVGRQARDPRAERRRDHALGQRREADRALAARSRRRAQSFRRLAEAFMARVGTGAAAAEPAAEEAPATKPARLHLLARRH